MSRPLEPRIRPPGRPPERTTGPLVKAILVGLAVDWLGSVLLSGVLLVAYATALQNRGLSSEEIVQAMDDIPPRSWVAIASLLLGACLDVGSGFVSARLAGKDEYVCGAILASLSAALTYTLSRHDEMGLLLSLCTVACTLLGIKLGRERNHRVRMHGGG